MTDFEGFQREVLSCLKCHLCSIRKKVVFVNGNPNAEIMLVGEVPGFYEDKSGIVFQGKS